MILEARSPSCFSDHYVLKIDGQAHGDYRGRWYSEGVNIRLRGQRRLHLQKKSWLGSRFKLTRRAPGPLGWRHGAGGLYPLERRL